MARGWSSRTQTTFVGNTTGGWRIPSKPTEDGDYLLTVDSNGNTGWRKTENGGSGELELGETSSTAYRGDRGAEAYEHVSDNQNPHNVTIEQIGAASKNGDCDTQFSVKDGTEDCHAINKSQLDNAIDEISCSSLDGGAF